MKSKSIIVIAVAFLIGVVHKFINSDPSDITVIFVIKGFFTGGFSGVFFIGAIPTVISASVGARIKKFPNNTFTALMYIMMILVVSLFSYGMYVTSSLSL